MGQGEWQAFGSCASHLTTPKLEVFMMRYWDNMFCDASMLITLYLITTLSLHSGKK